MSPKPPVSSSARPSGHASPNAADDVTLGVVQARGAQRNGAIWVLVISLSLAIVAMGAFWLTQAPRMGAVNHPSGQDLNTRDVRKLYAPPTPAPAAVQTTKGTGAE